MDKVQIKLVHEKLAEKPTRYGITQRSLLLYLAFLKGKPLASVEQHIHESTYHRYQPLVRYVRNEIDELGIVASTDFPEEAFVAWANEHTTWVKPWAPHVKKPRPTTKGRHAAE